MAPNTWYCLRWLVLSTLAVASLVAQSPTGSVAGRVLDGVAGPVADAAVTATGLATDRMWNTRSDESGSFLFPALPAGRYQVRVRAEGRAIVQQELAVEVGRTRNVELVTERRTETINVVGQAPQLDPLSSDVGYSVPREAVENLPLNQREFFRLALLAGGVQPSAPGSELEQQNNSGFSAHGARESANNYLLDGVDNNDLYINRVVVSPPLDAVREFRLHSADYRAEFGRSGGAQVNVVSRAGSNLLHASFYEYLRNDALDARNFFDQEKPAFRRNQFGASLGGPVVKQKAFFFAGYEGTRIKDAVTRTGRVPTAGQLAGDFSDTGSSIIDPFTQAPFPNNVIPAERLDPIAQSLARGWPAPNRADPNQNLVTTPVGDGLTNQFYGRADLYASDKDALFARYNLGHVRNFAPFGDGDTGVPGFGSSTLDRAQNFVFSETHVFNPRAVLEARFGYNRLRRDVVHQNAGNDVAAQLGIRGVSSDPRQIGFPAVNVGGFESLGDETALPILREDDVFHFVSNMTLLRGRHAWKFGGEARFVRIDGLQGLFGRGQLNFLGAISQNPLSDFVLGLPTFAIQTTVDNPFRQRTHSLNGFVQDDWRVTPKLTLNLGLRYEWNRPPVDADDRFALFDLDAARLIDPGTNDLGRAGYSADRNNFAPRLGLSWSPNSETVVRAAYGVFYDLAELQANSGLYFNPPYFDLRIFFPSQTSLLTLAEPFPTGAGFTPQPSVNAIDPNFRTGYLQHWNLGVEREVASKLVVRASYVGTKGAKLLRRRDLNQPSPGPGEVDSRRPIPGFANVAIFESGAASSYHSGVFSAERRFADRLSFTAAYTWSKSIDDASAFLDSDGDQGFPQNSQDFAAERGLSSFDQRHRFVFTGAYDVPFRHVVLRDWSIFAIGSFGSGRPFTPALTGDNSNTGNSGDSIFGQDRPDLVGDPRSGASTPERFFNTAAFGLPAPETFGNAGRNVLTGPGFASVDLALSRRIEVTEGAALDLRAEAFNLFNRANFGLPRRFADQPTFGRITAAGPARQVQLGLRLTF